jgi:quinolinate synthase
MNTATIKFDAFESLKNEDCQDRIIRAKKSLGNKIVILGHHYQNETVYRHADYSGDSLKLAQYVQNLDAKYIVFLGVHFMAEVSNILSRPERTYRELSKVLDFDKTITPITYINSAADLKAFCGEHNGIVCTSTNAPSVLDWAFKKREKVLFFPDQNLGRWTGHKMGIAIEDMPVWDPDLPLGGLSEKQILESKVLLWKGHCAVHQMFRLQHIEKFREIHPEGFVISHPESPFEVCQNSDYVGSTEFILNTITQAKPNTKWLVGTELNLVNRLANEMKPEGKLVQFMSHVVCECSTMARIDPQHLSWTLENIIKDNPVNIINVPKKEAELAKLALDRMLEIS